jgi:hypothetical protein
MIMFPSVASTVEMLSTQGIKFFEDMTPLDLQARNTTSRDAYKHTYMTSIVPFNKTERRLLNNQVTHMDKMCAMFPRLLSISWKFAKLKPGIEDDFPHTLGDTIFIHDKLLSSGDARIRSTLIHEKIHVYQRQYGVQTHMLVCNVLGFTPFDVKTRFPKIRNNPDTNGVVYTFGTSLANPCYQAYNDKPKSLSDSMVYGSCEYEHPYEAMAYILSDVLTSQPRANQSNDIDLLRWMQLHL